MTDYAYALSVLHPDRLWSLTDNNYATLVMNDDAPKPTKKSLDDAWSQLEYDRDYAKVEAKRRDRYQTETDGMFFAAQREGEPLDAWKAAVDQIKADLPYPTAP